MSQEKNSPLIEQYLTIKKQYPDCLLLFQVGDFYELFFEDAQRTSAFLALTLTKRGKNKGEDIPLCGIPVHTLHHYLTKLIKGGFSVALCQQTSKPIPGSMVERAVTQVFTPGMLTDETMLDEKSASYLLTIYPQAQAWGIIFTELLTANLFATIVPADHRMLDTELTRFLPDEVILPQESMGNSLRNYIAGQGYFARTIPYTAQPKNTEDELLVDEARLWQEEHLVQNDLEKISQKPALGHSLTMLYSYLRHHQAAALTQSCTFHFYEPEEFLLLDKVTQKNLEIIKNSDEKEDKHTLFGVLDNAVTPMGSRTIKKWLLRPLLNRNQIEARLQVVEHFSQHYALLLELRAHLAKIGDFERIVGRIALGRAQLQDYRQLKTALSALIPTKKIIEQLGTPLADQHKTGLLQLYKQLGNFEALLNKLQRSITDDQRQEWIIKSGFDGQLDYFRHLVTHGQEALCALEQDEITRTGISSLKIGHTHQSGYYIEVTHTHSHRIPHDYLFQQKLVNRSRYITQKLKELEGSLATAAEQQEQRQQLLYEEVTREIARHVPSLRQTSQALCILDALGSFAQTAREEQYIRPTFILEKNSNKYCQKADLTITQGRHPVVERFTDTPFVPNDTFFTADQQLLMITGPNMGGKSTYLRQVALMVIMAQAGSFVPAATAQLPLIDRIFTRIGSGDNVAQGKSTFLVEMEETAAICTQATERSLVILDEVGRGTSTNDGLALAHAIVEYILMRCKSYALFATHYHELTLLSQEYPTIANYHLTCQQKDQELIFLHHVQKGAATASFGLDVARQAGVPLPIIYRAQELLVHYEAYRQNTTLSYEHSQNMLSFQYQQEALFQPALRYSEKAEKLYAQIQALALNELTPKQALDLLYKLQQDAA